MGSRALGVEVGAIGIAGVLELAAVTVSERAVVVSLTAVDESEIMFG